MEVTHIGTTKFEIDPDALRQIIETGRVSEFASKAAANAAAQINAQIVDLVSRAALGQGIQGGLSVSFNTVFEGGDFGSTGGHGPRPHVNVVFGETALSQVVTIPGISSQPESM